MKIALMSDMHLEFGNAFGDYDVPDCDVLVLAGDIGVGRLGIDWAASYVQKKVPVIYVAGNHEYYGKDFDETLEFLKKYAKLNNIHFLENDEVTIDGVHFVGSTLWTDFNLYGNVDEGKFYAERGMSDFRVIRGMTTDKWQAMNNDSMAYLANTVTQDSIVITHFLPHENSIDGKWFGSKLNVAFTSHAYNALPVKPKLWFHGHTHDSCDYVIDETRVVCNPYGYFRQEVNPKFSRTLVIETD